LPISTEFRSNGCGMAVEPVAGEHGEQRLCAEVLGHRQVHERAVPSVDQWPDAVFM
jgi:hypothetical protein